MNFISVGDMARSYQMRHQSGALKQQLDTLTQELTTGQKADWAAEVRGDYSTVASIHSSLSALKSYNSVLAEARLVAEGMQGALGAIESISSATGAKLISVGTISSTEAVGAQTSDAKQKFLNVVGMLNLNIGGRYVFSGAATDQKPLASGEDILSTLSSLVGGQTGANAIMSMINDWFDAPPGGGGFMDVTYQGSSDPLGAMPASPNHDISLPITAANQELRDTLKGLAAAALVSEGVLGTDHIERSRLTKLAGEKLMAANGPVVELQADIGIQEEALSRAEARNAAETATLSVARTALAAADPYESATAIEAVKAQIETLYTITARMSRLNLANFL